MNKTQSNALQKDCRLYGLRKAGILTLRQIMADQAVRGVRDPRVESRLAAMRTDTERLETFFDQIERSYGIDSRMILWRYLINQEETEHIASDFRMCHQQLMHRIERILQEESYV